MGLCPWTRPRASAPWNPAKGAALGTLPLEWLGGRGAKSPGGSRAEPLALVHPIALIAPQGQIAGLRSRTVFTACGGLGRRGKIRVCFVFVSQGWGSVQAWGQHGASRQASHNRTRGAAPMRLLLSHPHASASICLHLRKTLLASPRAARCRDGARQRRASQNPMHQFAYHPAQHADHCRDGHSPCTVRRIAMPPTPGHASPGAATVRHAAKQERLNADAEKMHAKHADGPGSGTALHGRHRTTEPGEPHRGGRSCPIRVHQRPSACICVKPCLLRRAPHSPRRGSAAAPARTPCTNCPCPRQFPGNASPSQPPRNETTARHSKPPQWCPRDELEPMLQPGCLSRHASPSPVPRNETTARHSNPPTMVPSRWSPNPVSNPVSSHPMRHRLLCCGTRRL